MSAPRALLHNLHSLLSSHTPAPAGVGLASMGYGLPAATPARTASARSDGRSTLTPSTPAERAMAAKSGLYGAPVSGCLKSVASSRPARWGWMGDKSSVKPGAMMESSLN